MIADVLFDLPENPMPRDGDAGYFAAKDGRRLRYARFPASTKPFKGTVVVLSGRNECIEKYFETVGDLTRRGFGVAMMDWRGQGGSERLLGNPARGYVRTFFDYARDLEQFFQEFVLPDCRGPYYMLAHSTGGLVALLAAPSLTHRIRRMVLSAPLLALQGLPMSMRTIRRITTAMRLTGFGRVYASGGPRRPVPFPGNPLTSDERRLARNNALIDAFPDLGMGGPTVAWVSRLCEAADRVIEPDYMARIQIPILFVAAGADTVVSTPTIEKFARGLRSGAVVTIDGARHEILQEADIYREQLLAAFDAFVPGGEPADANAEEPGSVEPS